jgi:hypothetical protein
LFLTKTQKIGTRIKRIKKIFTDFYALPIFSICVNQPNPLYPLSPLLKRKKRDTDLADKRINADF